MTAQTVPIALTIAGSDPSGGAGIQADLKTFSALGVYGASVITALTAQNTCGVSGVLAVPQEFIVAQFDAVARDLAIGAIKTGMFGDKATVTTVAGLARRLGDVPLVVDPVMVATSGDILLAEDAISAVRDEIIPLATVITPNLPEAAALLGTVAAVTESDMIGQARALLGLGAKAVMLKGGHGAGDEAVDVLATTDSVITLRRPRVVTANTHGTGCTLSAAIAANLAMGRPLDLSAANAKDYVWHALSAGANRKVGHGNGPVDHQFALREH